ncbi:MAG: Phosphoglycerate mutase [Planctomycetaceae bacterium]|nr:Phosphoglycerate mutase [Planctomycetaceae bacterium]
MRTVPPSDTTFLYLIRHGATPPNEQRPYILQGNGIDLSLSPSGRRQAAEASEFLRDFPLNHIYCSSMIRARETAEAIAKPHGFTPQLLTSIVECSVGCWEGLDWESIKQRDPEACRLFQENPAANPYLGGESYTDVLMRVRPVFQDLLKRHRGESIVVVAHNIVNRVILADLLGLELCRAKDLRQQNACVNLISCDDQRAHVVTLNSVFHLSEAPL